MAINLSLILIISSTKCSAAFCRGKLQLRIKVDTYDYQTICCNCWQLARL